MSASEFKSLRETVRNDFRDELGTMFSDADLDAMFNEGQREYCIATGILAGFCPVITPISGESYKTPSDFIRPLRLLDKSNREIPPVSQHYLSRNYGDFRKIQGHTPQNVCYDMETWGEFRIFPTLPDNYEVGTLYYQRLPKEDTIEIKDILVLKEYALYLMYLFSSKQQAYIHLNNFTQLIHNRQVRPETVNQHYYRPYQGF